MTIEIEPTVLAEIKEHAKEWLDYETEFHGRVLKEKRWDCIGAQERTTMGMDCLWSIAHRIMEALYPEEYRKLMALIVDALNTVANKHSPKQED